MDALAARAPRGKLLSQRAAAQALGIGRDLVGELVRQKRVRTVPVRGQARIPASEVERLQEQGIPEAGDQPARGGRRRGGAASGRSIMGIPLD